MIKDRYRERCETVWTACDCRAATEAAPEMLKALLEIHANPGWQDPEVGYMSGHIAAHAIRKALGAEAGNAALKLSRHSDKDLARRALDSE